MDLKFYFYEYLAILTEKLQSHALIYYHSCGRLVQKVTGVQGSHVKMVFFDFQHFQQTSQPTNSYESQWDTVTPFH